jgi:hypothetical protein
MPREVRPYLLPSTPTAVLDPWQLAIDGDWETLPPEVPEWDATMTLAVRRTVLVDLDRLIAETRLNTDAALGWTVSWISSTSKMRGSAPVVPVVSGGPVNLGADLPGDRVGGTLTLRTTLSLLRPAGTGRPGAARLPGSVLIEDTAEMTLGNGTYGFPVQGVDFAATRLDPGASWHLETTTELTAPFLGTFLLLLNTRDTELVDAVSRDRRDRRQEALLEELEHGVAMLLLDFAAQLRSDLAEVENWPDGSVGQTLQRMLRHAERTGALLIPIGPHNLSRARTRTSIGHGRSLR